MIPSRAVEAGGEGMTDDIYSMTKSGFHEAIRQAKEEAWMEGYRTGELDGAFQLNGHEPPDERNPHRKPPDAV